jgi:hypothetical protein
MSRKRQRYSRRSGNRAVSRTTTPRVRVNPTVLVDTWRYTDTGFDYGLTCGHHVKISRERHPIFIRSAMACRKCGAAGCASRPAEGGTDAST